MTAPPQTGPLFSFYGDDFTGSTDALEALASNGIPTVLFTGNPTHGQLAEFARYRAFGIAGDSRSCTPAQMCASLPGAFHCLRAIGAPVVQYKICSTFDSSPAIGSIGCALEIGQQIFPAARVPIVAAAPRLGRYVAFSHLFAADNASPHRAIARIDRHPTMSRHPVTPMDEPDLRLHLARQTAHSLAAFPLSSIHAANAVDELSALEAGAVLFDGVTPADQARVAELIWQTNSHHPLFVIGSSGLTYGLLDYWRSLNWIPSSPALPRPAPADRLLVIAGSCSPVTGRQICWALNHGFAGIHLPPAAPIDTHAISHALDLLRAGRSLILYSALGPQDIQPLQDRRQLASALGQLLREIAARSGVCRVTVAGGDTSSHAIAETGVTALTYQAPLAPGAPLCLAHGGPLHGIEIVLKGGQIGRESFFADALAGVPT